METSSRRASDLVKRRTISTMIYHLTTSNAGRGRLPQARRRPSNRPQATAASIFTTPFCRAWGTKATMAAVRSPAPSVTGSSSSRTAAGRVSHRVFG